MWHNLNSIANVLSLHHMRDTHRVAYDSTPGINEDTFIVHTPRGSIRFQASPLGLFYTDLANLSAQSLNPVGPSSNLIAERQADIPSRGNSSLERCAPTPTYHRPKDDGAGQDPGYGSDPQGFRGTYVLVGRTHCVHLRGQVKLSQEKKRRETKRGGIA